MISPRVTVILADSTKQKLEMYDRPPEIEVEIIHKGELVRKAKCARNGPDSYREVVENG